MIDPSLDPYKTILILKHQGREVERIPATADNANDYLQEMASLYGDIQVDYEFDENAGLLAMLYSRR